MAYKTYKLSRKLSRKANLLARFVTILLFIIYFPYLSNKEKRNGYQTSTLLLNAKEAPSTSLIKYQMLSDPRFHPSIRAL